MELRPGADRLGRMDAESDNVWSQRPHPEDFSQLFVLGSTSTSKLYVNLDSSDREKFGEVWRGIKDVEAVCLRMVF